MATAFHDAGASVDFTSLMPRVAHMLLGDPNQRLSRGPRLRFGNKGSMEIDTSEGWFNDHEADVRGGVLDLIRHKERCDTAGAFRWLEERGLRDRARAAKSVATGPTFYDYCDENGAVLFRVERRGKDAVPPFLQHGPDGKGGFHAARGCMQNVRRVAYRLPEILAADPAEIVFVCEGEKDADRLTAAGLVATTNPGGAGKFGAEHAAPLQGRRVVVLQDNDEAGANHVAAVLAAVDGIAASASALLLPNLPVKGDVSDWLAQGGSTDELVRLAEAVLHVPAETFAIANLMDWAEREPTPKSFRMAGFVPEQEVTIFPGPGGVGKSTFALQLCACSAAGAPMLGIDVQQGPALYVTAEDDDRENHWRLKKIATAIGTTLQDLAGKLHIVSLRGKLNNELATFDGEGRLRPAPAYNLLRATIEATRSKLIVLDNVGHLYVGNEIDRGQVTGFINLLYQLCRELGVTVVLIAHPNKAGDSYSGSTAWLNAVRSQIILARPEDSFDPDQRVLTLGKANYARPDQQLTFRWHDFAFVRDEDLPADTRAQIAHTAAAGIANERFLELLEKTRKEKRAVSASRAARNFAPRVFAGMTGAAGVPEAAFEGALERLLHLEKIVAEGRVYQRENRAWVTGIVRTDRAPTPAPTMHEPPAQTRTLTLHQPAPSTHPYTTYREAGALEGPPASHIRHEPDHAPDQLITGTRTSASGMILAPGETGDEPIPGWDDWSGRA